MYSLGKHRLFRSCDRLARRPAFFMETLESRRLLSTATATVTATATADSSTTVAPLLATAEFGGFGGVGGGGITNPTPVSTALTPARLAAAYSISLSATSGQQETIAIVDAYNDPNIQADLAAFDKQYGLPAASLTVENQNGQTTSLPQTSASWSLEIALDVEWAHAAAPGANLVLVEANSASTSDLMAAVKTAANQASVVSMSWGGPEFRTEAMYDTAAYFGHPNVTFVAASGDDGGASGAEWPAVSPDVVSVGGTTLALTSTGAISSETAWNASGSRWTGFSGSTGGVSLYESLPSYQAGAVGTSVTRRATPDVASDANPNTGLSVYDSVPGMGQTGWFQIGGTSAGAPVWAGIIAAADQARAAARLAPLSSTQTLTLLYGLAGSSAYSTDFHDITSGANLVAAATKGYDMVTGLGSPVAQQLIVALSSSSSAASSASVSAKTTATTTTTTTTTGTTRQTPHAAALSLALDSSPAATNPVPTPAAIPVSPFVPQAVALVSPSPVLSSAAGSASVVAPALTTPALPLGQALLPSIGSLPSLSHGSTSRSGSAEGPRRGDEPGANRTGNDPVRSVLQPGVPALPLPLPAVMLPRWEDALETYLAESQPEAAASLGSSASEPEPEPERETANHGPDPRWLAGWAVTLWGIWELRSRLPDRTWRRSTRPFRVS
jgi:hypothetical protein